MRHRLSWGLLVCLLLLATLAHGASQYMSGGLVLYGPLNSCTSAVGTDSYACTLDRPATSTITAYNTNTRYGFKADVANTGASSINYNTIGAIAIKVWAAGSKVDTPTNTICIGQEVEVIYDGTDMQMVSQPCTASGGSGTVFNGVAGTVAFYPATGTEVNDSTGLTLSTTDILSESHAITAVSASTTVTNAQGVFRCDATSANVVLTLPAASTATAKKFLVYKTDASANTCGFLRAGSDTINGGTTATIAIQYGLVEVVWLTTSTWGASYGVDKISLTTDVAGILPVANGGSGTGTTLVGLLQGGSPFTVVTSSTVGAVLRVTSANAFAFGAVDLADTDAVTGTLPAGNLPTLVRSIYIPAGNFDVNGACVLGTAAVLLASGPKTTSITCTDAITDSIETAFTMPDGWNAGTITVELIVFNVGTNASTLVYEMSWIGKCVGSGEAPGTWAAVNHSTDVATSFSLTTTDNLLYQATSGALTLVGGCTAGDTVFLKGEIDATATTMTPMADVKILGAKVEYTRSGND